jgi:hypothetical protein
MLATIEIRGNGSEVDTRSYGSMASIQSLPGISTRSSQQDLMRGFGPAHSQRTVHSRPSLSPVLTAAPKSKKQPMFTLGGSSDEESSCAGSCLGTTNPGEPSGWESTSSTHANQARETTFLWNPNSASPKQYLSSMESLRSIASLDTHSSQLSVDSRGPRRGRRKWKGSSPTIATPLIPTVRSLEQVLYQEDLSADQVLEKTRACQNPTSVSVRPYHSFRLDLDLFSLLILVIGRAYYEKDL